MTPLAAYLERIGSISATIARYAVRADTAGLRDGARAIRAMGREIASQLGRADARRVCPVCGWQGPEFAPRYYLGSYREDVRCYRCGSTDRCRLVKLLADGRLRSFFRERRRRVLDIGPLWYSRRFFPDDVDYVSFDLHAKTAMVRGDLCAAPFPDRSFDLWLCFHVLDHIDDDGGAMRELYRLLEPGGIGLLDHTTDWNAATVEFGGARRVPGVGPVRRRYGMDLPDRLRALGFEVELLEVEEALDAATRTRHGIHPRRVIVCRRPVEEPGRS